MFDTLLTTYETQSLILCIFTSFLCGIILAVTYQHTTRSTKSFLVTLALLPTIVQIVIMMVNGNLGVGVAVAGSFSLVRFRSLPGKASDILIIFLAMGIGLCTGMGFILFAFSITVICSCFYVLLTKTDFLEPKQTSRFIRITIPEDLNYTDMFSEIFAQYTNKVKVLSVRTMNLGTLYQITYEMILKDENKEKELLDAMRVRNGNLAIICSKAEFTETSL